MITIGTWMENNRERLPEGEASLLLSFVLRREKTFLFAHPEYELTETEIEKLTECVTRREHHEPIAYITGEKDFFGRTFFVTPATLIPRPETEVLVEYVLEKIKEQDTEKISIIDIGTGSGCIPICITKTLQEKNPALFSRSIFLGADISNDALAIAEKNAKRHDIESSITLRKSDLLSDIHESSLQSPTIIITANLPYLSKEIYDMAPDDVRRYEPKSALLGDEYDGTTLIKELLEQCQHTKSILSAKHLIILEISPEQDASLLKHAQATFLLSKSKLLPDLTGRDRFLVIENW